jgi:phytoene dehydrogenase-like protein
MSRNIVIIGAGMGGLMAALRLAQRGYRVRVIEVNREAGGLASGFEIDGFTFDAGPYILLDRNGLEWSFKKVGLELDEHVSLRRIEDVYEVSSNEDAPVRFYADLEQTIEVFDRVWPGSGARYRQLVTTTAKIYQRLRPLQHVSHPGPADVLHARALAHVPFLLRSLKSVLARTGLPTPIVNAIAIWTHVAGQSLDRAPSPLAFVPALIHTIGAYYPVAGIGSIPRALAKIASAAGVEFEYGTKIHAIRCERGRVTGVETERGAFIRADAVVSNHSGVGTYLKLATDTPRRVQERLSRLPLQSPGVCAYLAIKGRAQPPYLRFQLPGGGQLCRLLVTPGVVTPEVERGGWSPARLIATMRHTEAERGGPLAQREYLDCILAESWWRKHVDDYRILATRIPAEWGAQFQLYRDSMNPVMTAQFMRAGRLAHRSPYLRGLYLAGSSTHPGQWVSFCAISGILAADRICEDLR